MSANAVALAVTMPLAEITDPGTADYDDPERASAASREIADIPK